MTLLRLSRRDKALLLFVFMTVTLIAQDNDLFSEKNLADYALYLYNTGQYSYAAEEYERLVYMNKDEESYKIDLLRSYRYAGEYDKGITSYKLLSDPQVPPGFDLVREYAKLNLLGSYPENLQSLLVIPGLDKGFQNNLDLTIRLISYPEYSLSLEGLDNDLLDNNLVNLYNEAFTLKYKSRFLAGSLSAIIPGMGKVYTGRWKDGIISLLFVAGTGYQAYRAFNDKGFESVYGWIMGSLSLGFYLGNIYGSAKSARLYNTNQDQHYHEKVTHYYIDHY